MEASSSATSSNSSATLYFEKQPETKQVLVVTDIEYGIGTEASINELKEIGKLAWPIIIENILQSVVGLANIQNAGSLGTEALAAVTLSSMMYLVAGLPVMNSILSALETLASQAFTSSGSKHRVGLLSQRAAVLLMIYFIPLLALFLNSEHLLLSLGQDVVLAQKARIYLGWFILAVPSFFLGEVAKKYMQVQALSHLPLIISFITTPIHIVTIRYLVSNLGFIGLPIASLCYGWFTLFLQILFISQTRAKDCWGGFSMEAFSEWQPFIRLSIPGVAMIAGLMWPIEAVSLAASYFGTVSLSSHAITNSTFQLIVLFYNGLTTSTSIRIGNQLGAGFPNRARLSALVALGLGFGIGALASGGLILEQSNIIRSISNDFEVIKLASKSMLIMGLGQFFAAGSAVSSGILRGQGRQRASAFFKITGGYLVAIPIGFTLAWHYDYGLIGLWSGVFISWIYCAMGEMTAVFQSDWHQEVINCQKHFIKRCSAIINDPLMVEPTNYGTMTQV